MSLLSLIQKVADRVGVTRPTVVVTSTDIQIRQLYALANEEGAELAKRGPWQALTQEQTFVTVAQAEQTNTPVPDDFDRFIPNSFYNRTLRRRMIGPITPQEWQAVQAFPAYNRVYLAFRQRDGAFLITPDPPAGQTIAYEYVSANWAMSSAGQGKPEFTSDDDSSFLDENLLASGIRWRWKQAKGLDYSEDMITHERSVSRALGNDGGATILTMGSPTVEPVLLANIPDGSFGI